MNPVRLFARRVLRRLTTSGLAGLAWVVTGVRPIWAGSAPSTRQRIYFANHASHGDFILLATCLPPRERAHTRAVAAADYWGVTKLRRYIAETLLNSVLIDRNWAGQSEKPLDIMRRVLDQGYSLIIFPEGQRNMTDEPLLRFKSGLYNLAQEKPEIELIPCWIENMSRVLPKGEFLPVPLLCRVVFGAPMALEPDEDRHAFLARAHAAILALNPRPRRNGR